MYLTGARGQQNYDQIYDASGVIIAGGTAQLLLPRRISTSYLHIQNTSDIVMYIKFGAARAHATLTSGVVSSVTVDDGGFGFTAAPIVECMGGGQDAFWGTAFVGASQPGYPSPVAAAGAGFRPAKLKAVLAAGVVTSITIEDGGAGYKKIPYLNIINSQFDPIGCATAAATAAAGSGSLILPPSGGAIATVPGSASPGLIWNGTFCPTDAISILGATTDKTYSCYWAP